MFLTKFICVCVFGVLASARPNQDVQIVESTIREVRAVAPDDLLLAETNYGHNYGADDEDAVGYLKRSEDGGSDGYKHFDSYHIKDGDKYGYEKHSAFGKANNYENDVGATKDDGESGSYKVAEELNEDDEHEHLDSSEKLTDAENVEAEGHYEEADDDEGAHYAEGAHYKYDDDGESAKYSEGNEQAEYDF